jgi:hypothetical protein
MPFLVPNLLLLAVPLDGGPVLFAIPPPVVRVAGTPFLRTVPAYQAVFRIRSVLCAAAPLAVGLAAHRLRRLIFRWSDSFTVAA